MPPQNFLRTSTPFMLSGHILPPCIGRPGLIHESKTLFFSGPLVLYRCGDEPVPFALGISLEKSDGFLQALVLTAGTQVHHREQAKELRAMLFVERPEKLLVVVSHMCQMLFAGLQ